MAMTRQDAVLVDGLLSAVLSAATLAWRGRAELGSAAAPINAPSQWVHGPAALHRDGASLRHTALGGLVHGASSLLWAGIYEWLQARRWRSTPGDALIDAAAVTAVAAVVDLALVPKRLSPGFQKRLSMPGVVMVYASFGLGLMLGGLRRRRR
ncbi:hypothetical protein [Aquabacterium humicola]|uniref:hypothetical protein n=1 Tax=Aquabacterium humicola TaxID=3237377 RepID=UPI0025428C65|nr:hypothetical protein [Rubrivivax pictus]